MVGGEYAARAERAHHLADAHRRDIRARLVHPPPHGGIEGYVEHLYEDLAVAWLGHGLLGVGPVVVLGQPGGARGEPELMVCAIHGTFLVGGGLAARGNLYG